MDRRSAQASLAALIALSSVASAQETRWARAGEQYGEAFGWSVAWVGDWDGDGQPDFAAGSSKVVDSGGVLVVSGATGAMLLSFSDGDRSGHFNGFGERVFAIGDVDGDGKTELVVYASASIDPATGAIGSLSSWDSSGQERWNWRPAPTTKIGRHPAVIGDVDGDAIRDLIVCYEYGSVMGADVLSGATGQWIRSHSDPVDLSGSAYRVGALGDCDLDGVADYGVVAGSLPASNLYAFSGATGAPLWTAPLAWVSGVVPVEDVDGDSIGDAVVFGPGAGGSGTGAVLSGGNGLVLRWLGGNDSFRDQVAAGDLDGDGIGDVVGTASYTFSSAELVAYSPVTGLEIARRPLSSVSTCDDLDGGVDFDGDGHVDLLCGLPDIPHGEVAVIGLGGWNELFRVEGRDFNALGVGSGAALVPDRDGDGAPELAVAVVTDVGKVPSYVQLLSSSDGHELARVPVAGGIASMTLPLIGVPDVDGDHVDDWAFAAADRTVEVRSGRDDSLLRTWSLASGTPTVAAAAIDAAGHSYVAFATFLAPDKGEIAVHDLTTGAAPLIVKAKRWSSVSCVGDVNGDAVLDWVACDVGPANGALRVFSGATGATIWTVNGGPFIRASFVRSVDDLNGDGKDDVLAASIDPSQGNPKVVARNGVTGAKLFEVPDPFADSGFGAAITPLGDLDHDGTGDFAIGAPDEKYLGDWMGFVDLYSGRTARLLRRIQGSSDSFPFPLGNRFGERFAELARGSSFFLRENGRRKPALVAAAPTAGWIDEGCVQQIALGDLFLDVPSAQYEGFVAWAYTRGGKPGSLAGLYLVAIDGVPVDQFGAFGVLDTFGEWTTSEVVPPGLAGTVFTLRSYAVGWDGNLSWSTDETMTIL